MIGIHQACRSTATNVLRNGRLVSNIYGLFNLRTLQQNHHQFTTSALRNNLPETSDTISDATSDTTSSSSEPHLNIDASASERLSQILDEGEFLRVFVEGGGCSGFQYKFEVDKDLDEEEDVMFDKGGGRVVCDKTSLDILKGSTLEFTTDMLRAGFRISDIPQAEKGCSCGVSFSVKLWWRWRVLFELRWQGQDQKLKKPYLFFHFAGLFWTFLIR